MSLDLFGDDDTPKEPETIFHKWWEQAHRNICEQCAALKQYHLENGRERNDDEKPALPYDGGSGWSVTETSKERETVRDSGATKKIQDEIMRLIERAGSSGMNWKEVQEALPWDEHHGNISGALSNLHKAGRIDRLREARNGSKIYVTPEQAEGRIIEPQGRLRNCPNCGCDL